MSDETMPAPAGDDDSTAVVPDSGAADVTTGLAWSADEPEPEVEPASDDRRPLSLPLRVLLISVLIAAVGLAAFVWGGRALPVLARHIAVPAVSAPIRTPVEVAPPAGPSSPPQANPPPQAIPPPTVAEPPPTLTPDEIYLQGLERIGIQPVHRAGAIHDGHLICDDPLSANLG